MLIFLVSQGDLCLLPACLPPKGKSYHLGIVALSPVQKTKALVFHIMELKPQFNLFHSSVNVAHFLSGQKTNPKGNSKSGAGQLDKGHKGPGGGGGRWGEKSAPWRVARAPSVHCQSLPLSHPEIQSLHTYAHGYYLHGPFQLFILDGVVKGLGER